MRRSLLVSFFLAVLCSTTLFAQEGRLTGKIIDVHTKEPLFGATIMANPGVTNKTDIKGTVTDSAGYYSLSLVPGIYFVDFTFIGYERLRRRVVIEDGRESVENIDLDIQATDLGIVTVSSSKYEKKFGEESVTMDVLLPSLIEDNNITTLDKAVDKVPGVNMIGETINIRGGAGYSANAGSRVLALFDDVPWLTPQNSGISFWAAPLENVKQVEIIKGASSVLYGSSALNGTLNIITEWPKEEPFSKVNLYSGLYENPLKDKKGSYWADDRLRMMYGFAYVHRQKVKKFDYVVDASYNRDESYLYNDEKDRVRLNFKTRYRLKDNLSFGINGNQAYQYGGFFFLWADYDTTAVGDSLSYVPNEVAREKEFQFNLDPYLTYFDKKGNKHSFKVRYYYVMTRTGMNENTNGGVLYGEYTFHGRLKPLGLDFVAGASGSQTMIDSEIFSKRKSTNASVFLQVDKKFFDKLTFTAGVRGELFKLDTTEIELQPIARAGINYQPAESSYIRASFGMGYRYPSIAEKFALLQRAGQYVVPNPDLQPESSWSAEVGYKQAFKISNWVGYLDVSGYITQYHNMMEFTAAPPEVKHMYFPQAILAFWSENITDARVSGIEISALGKGKVRGVTVNFLVGYTYMYPIDLNYVKGDSIYAGRDNNILNFRFMHSAKGDVQWEFKGVTMGITAFINSFMENIDPKINLVKGVRLFRKTHEEPTYALDARVGYDFSERTKVAFIAKNVTNNSYSIRPGFLEAPRNYTVQLSYEF